MECATVAWVVLCTLILPTANNFNNYTNFDSLKLNFGDYAFNEYRRRYSFGDSCRSIEDTNATLIILPSIGGTTDIAQERTISLQAMKYL